jgi:crotonobetainyl-CoA:carnitine CoA-transferase CaiB-like acyl-CoA transferase
MTVSGRDTRGSDVLEGVTVLTLTSTLPGALMSQFFADHGADVTLLEPLGGSPLRTQAGWPAWVRGSVLIEATLDDPEVLTLARRADVVFDAFRPGVAERHGLDYESLVVDNPGLVRTSVTAFGRTGPLSRLRAYEGVVMAKVGAYSQFAGLSQRPGPGFLTVPIGTVSASFLGIAGTLVALFERERSGVGQQVDTTFLQGIGAHDVFNWMVALWARKYPEAFESVPAVDPTRRVPNSWLAYSLLQSLTADGRWLQFSQATAKQFRAFLVALGVDEPKWEDAWQDEDLDRREAFWERLLAAVRDRTLAEWWDVFDEHPDVFAEVYRSGTELLEHPQLLHDNQVVTVEDPVFGPVKQLRPMVRLTTRPAPRPARPDHAEGVPPSTGMPLEGVTIVELGSFYAALFGVTTLADLGARVLKIEEPGGDPIRYQLAFPDLGAVKVLQGKESVAVDIKTDQGHAIAMRLIESADIVLVSFRAGVAERLGLGEEALRAVNPNVVFHEAPGFGTGGPYGRRPAYAPTISAGSGMARRNLGALVRENPDMSVAEVKDGALRLAAGGGVVGHPDGFSSLGVACGLALGLFARERGRGAPSIVTTMLSTMGHVLSEDMIEYPGRPKAPTADETLLGFGPLYRLYEAAEGWVFLAVCSDAEWELLLSSVPLSAGLRDDAFAETASRAENADQLAERLAVMFRSRPAAEWEAMLTVADVACVEVVDRPSHEVLMGPEGIAHELGMTAMVEHHVFGEHARLRALIDFSRSSTRAEPAMAIGQHTEAVLREFGWSDAEIERLAEEKVILLG